MNNLPGQSPSPSPVTAQQIAQNLQDATNPLDFITKNLQQPQPASTVVVPRPEPQVQPISSPLPGQQAAAQPTVLTTPDPEPPPLIQDPPKPEETSENALLAEIKNKGPQDSIRDLRKKANELKTQVEEREAVTAQLQQELEKYKTGEALPDVVKQKEARISELEKYERLHALKLSPEYQRKYVEPLTQLREKALTLAKEYDVEPDILDEALGIESKRELNSYLREHFDDMGALEVRDLIFKIRETDQAAQEAEREPAQSFEKIKEEFQREQAAVENRRINSITTNAQNGWVEALTELRAKGDYPELEMSEATAPIIQGASEEYGKFVTLLGRAGLKDLPAEAAKILAKRFQLSQAASITAQSRNAHYNRAQDVLATAQRHAPMVRPAIGGGTPASVQEPRKPQSPKEAAQVLLDQVLQKR